MITSDVSCSLVEADFAGIEAVLTGFFLYRHGFDSNGAKQYIRLARLGMHAAVTGLKVGKPVDLSQSDDIVKPQLAAIKKAYPKEYDVSKRTVHAKNFFMSVYGQVEKFPEFFPTIAAAQEFENYYYSLAPDLPKWHRALHKQARDAGFLGGFSKGGVASIWDSPYGYRHWFHDVLSYQPCAEFKALKWLKDPTRAHKIVCMHGRPFEVRLGGDAARCVAFYPQSTAAGRLKEAEMRLFADPAHPDYIGDAYFGRTPLLGPIHDSILLHVPNRCLDRVIEIVARVMQEPSQHLPIPTDWGWGDYLPIGVAAKVGKNWGEMEDVEISQWVAPVPMAGSDDPVLPREGEGDLEDWQLLQRVVA